LDCGLPPVVADGVASADGVEAGGGIVMLGFFPAGACLEEEVDCAVPAGGSRRTGVSGPAAGGASAAAEGWGSETDVAVVEASAACAVGGASSIAARVSGSKAAAPVERVGQLLRIAWWGIATPVLGVSEDYSRRSRGSFLS
jgi:hypothetical protein